jgi:hypothetical protein
MYTSFNMYLLIAFENAHCSYLLALKNIVQSVVVVCQGEKEKDRKAKRRTAKSMQKSAESAHR